eukprot:scaffold25377_cov82-Phaeocystis_antarctica.AAC.2
MIAAAGFAAARVGTPFSTAFCTTLLTAGLFSGVAACSWASRATRARLDAAWHIARSRRRTRCGALGCSGQGPVYERLTYLIKFLVRGSSSIYQIPNTEFWRTG